jgi:hypothetical protein
VWRKFVCAYRDTEGRPSQGHHKSGAAQGREP